MTVYYWEGQSLRRCGQLQADTDTEAIEQKPSDAILVYKESDTKNGLPFITIWEKELDK